jgi:uncharacterized membrane protein YphA (DoxX/SURF4 family)
MITGGTKLLGVPFQYESFASWGYPPLLMHAVGVVEVLCAIGIIFPKTRHFSVFFLYLIMGAATGTHFVSNEFSAMIVPLVMTLGIWITDHPRIEVNYDHLDEE